MCVLNLVLYNYESGNSRGKSMFFVVVFKKDVPNIGGKSGVSGRTWLLPGTLAYALVVLHNTLPTGHETSHDGWAHRGEDVGRWLSIFETLLRY